MALNLRFLSRLSYYCLTRPVQISKASVPVRSIKRWVAPTLRELQRRKDALPEEKPSPRSSFVEWNYDAEIFAFGKRLGEEFEGNVIRQSLTHKSYVFQQQKRDSNAEYVDNSAMIIDGEKLLTEYVKNELKKKYPAVIVDAVSQYLTNEEKLAFIAKHIGLTDLIRTEEFPIGNTTLSNTFKAMLSALEQSSGIERTHQFINDFVFAQLNGVDVFDIWEPSEPYVYLKDLIPNEKIEARLCNQSASSTILANYQVGLYNTDNKKLLGIGWGESIDNATNTAALNAIRKIYQIKA